MKSFSRGGSPGGQNALRAILDAMPQTELPSSKMLDSHDRPEPQSASASATAHATMVDEVLHSHEGSENVPATTDHAIEHSGASSNSVNETVSSDETHQPTSPRLAAVHANPFESTDAIHQHLVQLKPQELCRALAEVETTAGTADVVRLAKQRRRKCLSRTTT